MNENCKEEIEFRPKARSVPDAARAIGVSTGTIYRLARDKRLRLTKIGARTIILETEIDRVLREVARPAEARS